MGYSPQRHRDWDMIERLILSLLKKNLLLVSGHQNSFFFFFFCLSLCRGQGLPPDTLVLEPWPEVHIAGGPST